MQIDTSIDHHVHTRLCHHGIGEMEEYVLAAIDCGLSTLQFLEHMEEQVNYFESTWLTDDDFSYYFHEGKRLREKYGSKITLKLGVEVGFNPVATEKLLSRIAAYPFDAVGISCHFISHQANQYDLNLFSRKDENINAIEAVGRDASLTSYFMHLIEGVNTLPGTMVCHLDGALRHLFDLVLNDYHHQLIDTLLRTIRKREMMLEVNTSGFTMRSEPFPASWIIKRLCTTE